MHYLGPCTAPPARILRAVRTMRGPCAGPRPGNSRFLPKPPGAKRISDREILANRSGKQAQREYARQKAFLSALRSLSPADFTGFERILPGFFCSFSLDLGRKRERREFSCLKFSWSGLNFKKARFSPPPRDFRRRPEIFAAAQRFSPPPIDFSRGAY